MHTTESDKSLKPIEEIAEKEFNPSFCYTFLILFLRSWRNMMRNASMVRIKLITTIAIIFVMSITFWMIGTEEDKTSVQDRQGLFFFYLLAITFSATY